MLKKSKRMLYLMQNSNFKKYNYNISYFKRNNSFKSYNNEYNKEDGINNEKTNFDTPQKESSLNYKIKLNSFTNEKNNKKIFTYMNDTSNNAEIHLKDLTFGRTSNNFDQHFNGNRSNNLKKYLTYKEEKKDSKIIITSQEKWFN